MSFQPNDVVRVVSQRTSTAGGNEVVLSVSSIGRVCRVTPGGTCWVQFGGSLGCRRLHEDSLELATGPAPSCTANCRNGVVA